MKGFILLNMAKKYEIDLDKIYETKRGEQYKIIQILGARRNSSGKNETWVRIKFLVSGYEKDLTFTNANRGITADPYTIDVLGVGYKGEIEKGYDQAIYNRWFSMLSRCHNKNDQSYPNYGGVGVTVCDRWHCFANFYEDFQKLPGYEEFVAAPLELKGFYHLDKDLKQQNLAPHEKVYSPETCTILFISKNSRLANRDKIYRSNNNMLINNNLERKPMYFGVQEINGKYHVSISHMGIIYNIGDFYHAECAANAYNYVMSFLPDAVKLYNQDFKTTLEISEWMSDRCSLEPIGVPEYVIFPKEIEEQYPIAYGNSLFGGVVQIRSDAFMAYYPNPKNDKDIIIVGYFTNDLAAANAVNHFAKENNFPILNNALIESSKWYLSLEETYQYMTVDNDTFYKNAYTERINLITNKFQIGDHYFTPDGREYEIIAIDEGKRSSYLKIPITIRFCDTGYETTIISKVIERGLNIEDKLAPTVLGIACIGSIINRDANVDRLYSMWYNLLNKILRLNGSNYINIIDPRWLNFTLFLEDAPHLEGYDLFLNQTDVVHKFNKVTFGNAKYQLDIPFNCRKWGPKVTYYIYTMDEVAINNSIAGYLKSYGVELLDTNLYKSTIYNPYNGKDMVLYFTNYSAAINAVNYYYDYFFKANPNKITNPMSLQKAIQYQVLDENKTPLKRMTEPVEK